MKVINFKNAITTISDNQKDLGLLDYELEYNHHPGIIGDDHTLCGLAWGEYVEQEVEGKVTCPDCIAIIENLKKLKKGVDYE